MIKWFARGLFLLCLLLALVVTAFRISAAWRESDSATAHAPADGRFVETPEGRVFVLEMGPLDGTPLLFLHGTGAWSGLWRDTLKAAADQGYRTIAMDLTPFGFSDRAVDRDYRRTRQADRVLALVEALEVRPVMVAHSFGAAPGAEAVMVMPEAFAGLVLVAGALGVEVEGADRLPLPLRNETARRWIGAATALNPWLTRPLLRMMLHQTNAATADRVAILQRPMTRDGSTEAFADWLPGLLVADRAARSTQAAHWQGFTLPLALIWGREDRLTPPAQAEALAALTGAPVAWLKAVGHIPQIEDPDAFQAALWTALSGITDASR